jgi:hypothetical protein
MACAVAALWSLALLGIAWGGQTAARGKPSEDEVKAVYLFNFGKFVRWPANPTTATAANASAGTVVKAGAEPQTFDICVLSHDPARDPVAEPLTRVAANDRLGGLPVRVRVLDSAFAARGCAIVYMGSEEAPRIDQDLSTLRRSEALTVSDLDNFMERGGMLQFLVQGDRVRFEVNLDAVGHSDLQLSSELLKVAARVLGKPRREVSP